MADYTLLDFDIITEARRKGLLVPFDERQLKGASYDIRVGDYAIAVQPPEEGGYLKVNLKQRQFLEIHPNQTVVVYSLERLGIPPDMKGRLSLRSFWAIKGLYYNGGVVDPGYTGILFFNVTNLGTSPVRLDYAAGLVTAEFVRLDQPSQKIYNGGQAITDVPEEKLPPLPLRGGGDLETLQLQVETLETRLQALEALINSKQ